MTSRKVAGGGRTTYELTAIAKDGRRPILEISSRLLLCDGKPVGVLTRADLLDYLAHNR